MPYPDSATPSGGWLDALGFDVRRRNVESASLGESGGIGRRARLRIWYRKMWGFESPLSHCRNVLPGLRYGFVGIRRNSLRVHDQPLRSSLTRQMTSAVLNFRASALTALIGKFRTSETTSEVSSRLSSEVP